MKIKIGLLSATALTALVFSAVTADDNIAYITQNGPYNQASIEQSGDRNQAGSDSLKVQQVRWNGTGSPGRFNTLTILQSGDDNKVGLEANFNPIGAANTGGIQQRLPSNSGGVSNQNILAITQQSDGNVVGAVYQWNLTHRVGGIEASIVQGGEGGHRVGSILQERGVGTSVNNNIAPLVLDVTQNGRENTVQRVLQRTVSNQPEANTINVVFNAGSASNGNGNWSIGSAAAASGAVSSTLIQGAETGTSQAFDNTITVQISGSGNQYGVSQVASGGVSSGNVANVNLNGDSNELGVYQQGTDNTGVSTIAGNENIFGLRQLGEGNSANLTVTGNGNGAANGFSGAASLAGLSSGLLTQDGISNNVALTVTGNTNAFASAQIGDDNEVTGVQNGNQNQAAVAQSGNNNFALFSQSGSSNNLGIRQ